MPHRPDIPPAHTPEHSLRGTRWTRACRTCRTLYYKAAHTRLARQLMWQKCAAQAIHLAKKPPESVGGFGVSLLNQDADTVNSRLAPLAAQTKGYCNSRRFFFNHAAPTPKRRKRSYVCQAASSLDVVCLLREHRERQGTTLGLLRRRAVATARATAGRLNDFTLLLRGGDMRKDSNRSMG